MEQSEFPTPKDVKRHWDAQDPSVFRKPYSRDPGHSIVPDAQAAKALIEQELAGQQVNLYKQRTPPMEVEDLAARVQRMIRFYHAKQPTEEEFKGKVETLVDHQLMVLLYGDMSASQRSKALAVFAKQLLEEHKHHADTLHKQKQLDQRNTDNLIKATRLQEDIRKRRLEELAKQPPIDGELSD